MSVESDKMQRVEDQGLFERIIRTDERASEAHRRLDQHETMFTALRAEISVLQQGVSDLKVAVGNLNVKVSMAAAFGSLVGGGAIAVIVKVFG